MFIKMIGPAHSRRGFLSGAAMLVAGAVALGGCSTAQVSSFEASWASVAGTVQSAVNAAVGYIPTIESIAATAAGLFGPTYAALVTAGSALFNQLVSTLVNVVNNISPPAAQAVRARLARSSASVPVLIGVTPGGVQVLGWKSSS
jgi:hypothetical protein